MENYQYRIGLDIGIASVGWAVLETNAQGEPKRIADLGVRIFTKAEHPKDGSSLAAPRRSARSVRRRLRRRKFRIQRVKGLFEREGLITKQELEKSFQTNAVENVYELRAKALDRRITNEELAHVLLHIAKHRGFKSNRKAEAKDNETGAVLSAIRENEQRLLEGNYRTVGEMIAKDESFREDAPWNENHYIFTPRNKAGNYKHTVLRDMLVKEVHCIFEAQRSFGNNAASEKLENDFIDIFTAQRSFDMGPGGESPYGGNIIERMLGKCTFEKNEPRAPKGSYTAERFVILPKINNLRIKDSAGSERGLTEEERKLLLAESYKSKELKYTKVRKILALRDDEYFKGLNYGRKEVADVEKATFVKATATLTITKILEANGEYDFSDLADGLDEKRAFLVDEIARLIATYKEDAKRREGFEQFDLDDETVDKLLELNDSKFQHLSFVAMQKLMPYLEEGYTYNEACERVGYDFKDEYHGEKFHTLRGNEFQNIYQEELADITSPVVKRAISQTIKVVNAIIDKYGSPQAINVELAREMSRPFNERSKMEKDMLANQANNEAILKRLREEYGVSHPTGQDIIRFKLWQDQDGRCLYSGEAIPIDRLFAVGETDIDHIIPYSISFDDRLSNKVLVKAKCNREKGNRLPYEYLGNNPAEWEAFKSRVDTYVKDSRKRNNLKKEKLTEEDRKGFKERNLTDTKFATVVVTRLLRNYLEMAPIEGKHKHVTAVNGSVTAFLRKRWGLSQKDRRTDTHHARDAVVIAACTDGMIQMITRFSQLQELKHTRDRRIIDPDTGEELTFDEKYEQEWLNMYGKHLPTPWPEFREELELRMMPHPEDVVLDDPRKFNQIIGYKDDLWGKPYEQPIFVSRMPNHKTTGAGHAETIRSARLFDSEGVVITKTALQDLKLDKEGQIDGYYNKESDRLLYDALLRRLQMYSGDAKKAFPEGEDFHKPTSTGEEGPVVKKVKIMKKQTAGVSVGKGGIAENGGMIRVDVFQVNKKYYFVPIYYADAVAKRLPNKACVALKPKSEWKEMEDQFFIFSLYPGDLLHFKHKKGMKVTYFDKAQGLVSEDYIYFTGADIATASFAGDSNDKTFSLRGMGIQSLEVLEKCQVDVLGNITKVNKETRMTFR